MGCFRALYSYSVPEQLGAFPAATSLVHVIKLHLFLPCHQFFSDCLSLPFLKNTVPQIILSLNLDHESFKFLDTYTVILERCHLLKVDCLSSSGQICLLLIIAG